MCMVFLEFTFHVEDFGMKNGDQKAGAELCQAQLSLMLASLPI